MSDSASALLMTLFQAALQAADPYQAVQASLRRDGSLLVCSGREYDLNAFDKVLVIGAGKASAAMGRAAENILDDCMTSGILIARDGGAPTLRKIDLREAAHPVPDSRGQEATRAMLSLLARADARTFILCLLSGGGSALLCAPAAGITLGDKQAVTDLLLRAGADIGELNAVRKHLSAVKGGGLSRAACASTMVTLILSDVLGDRLDVIASGPTVSDNSTYGDARKVIAKYGLGSVVPDRVRNHLERGSSGLIPETLKPGDPCLGKKYPVVIAGLGQALAAVKHKADALGVSSEIVTPELNGEARNAARFLAEHAIRTKSRIKPGEKRCLLSGGETTVTVTGSGFGGRNQELALSFALEIAGSKGITLLSAGTDGSDGPTDATGALVDGDTTAAACAGGIDAEAYLARNDSYSFFQQFDSLSRGKAHIKTGPTGTNVMDIQLVLVQG